MLTRIYDIPSWPRGRWLKIGIASKVVGGWTISAIQRYRSGVPLVISTGGYEDQALFTNGGWRGDVVLPRDQQTLATPSTVDPTNGTQYLNTAAFANPPRTSLNVPTRLGNAPRYLPDLRGFAIWSEDFSMIKQFALGFREGTSVELRMDALNVFNRVRMGDPSTNVNDPQNFGKIFGKNGGPRNIQIGLRLNF